MQWWKDNAQFFEGAPYDVCPWLWSVNSVTGVTVGPVPVHKLSELFDVLFNFVKGWLHTGQLYLFCLVGFVSTEVGFREAFPRSLDIVQVTIILHSSMKSSVNQDKCCKTSQIGLNRLLSMQVVFVSFLNLVLEGKMALAALRGCPQSLKGPSQSQKCHFMRKWMQ